MKLKLLLIALLVSAGILNAQDTIRSLIISEASLINMNDAYVELTNMGDEPVDLSQFKFGLMRPWIPEPVFDVWNDPWVPEDNRYYMLPKVILQPGESWVQTTAYDFGPEQYRKKVPGFEGQQREKQVEMYDLADYLIHVAEPKGDETDSITTSEEFGDNYQWVWETWSGRGCFYIEQQFEDGGVAVIDQVGGVFDNNGKNYSAPSDVAGVEDATGNSILVRKFRVKTGNLDFNNARGVGLDDSEWIPIPFTGEEYRKPYWTIGNHGAYSLTENTLVSDVADIDLANKTITVPWGTRRGDGVMKILEKKPGIGWEYFLNANHEDSLSFAAHTGDMMNIYVCGNDLDFETFNIVVADPANDINIIVPVSNEDPDGGWRDNIEDGILGWPRVTEHESGTDTITGNWFGIPYATRTDSLLERLEKPINATWDFEWIDGVERADLKDGDQLVITAENGDVKKYHIQVQPFQPSHNANLSAVTWPDIPDFYRGIFGWMGDTIPNFSSTSYNYRMQVPFDVDGIPALVPKKVDLNSKIEVKRATTLSGTPEQRTVEFVVTAEDDSVTNTYSVEMNKEKPMDKVQPFRPDPILSEYIWWEQWSNCYIEIANPGNQPLDLSDYMIAMNWIPNPADMITSAGEPEDWPSRYNKYVFGYKWVNESKWQSTPATLEQDLNVSPLLEPGDVFCLGATGTTGTTKPDWLPDYVWPVPKQLDIHFNNHYGNYILENPWGEEVNPDNTPLRKWKNASWYMFKILNDSIKLGLKPATDPNDFELIETFSMGEVSSWIIGGEEVQMVSNWMRKPEIWQPNPAFKGSFGTTPEDSEWTSTDRPYWQAKNVGWPLEILNINNDLGQHYMIPPTHYMSTISSIVYKTSDGYSHDEEIRGPRTSQTVSDFLDGIIKSDEKQVLKVVAMEDGSDLAMDELLTMNDTLIVMSADSMNITKYRLDVTEDGLNSDAVITSKLYTIEITDQPLSVAEGENAADDHMGSGTITGFEYGTQLRTVLNNIEVPMGANLTVINEEGAYVPLTMLNFDTSYVVVTVTHNQYFEVVAEDGETTILYQLQPQASESSAFLTSDVYTVVQRDFLVQYVPRGTAVSTFLENVTPSFGATIEIIDKFGLERTDGNLVQDDRVVITSPDGTVQTVYYLSMLRTEHVRATTYLAYVTSRFYNVDQLDMTISGATGVTELAEFYSRIDPATGATFAVVDAEGNEKDSGDLDDGDRLKVISADGVFEVFYELNLDLTFTDLTESAQIRLYPNPTNGKLNVTGVEPGGKIQVFNSLGSSIDIINVQSSTETVSLDDHPAGMYLIVISNAGKKVGKYKVVRK